MVRYSSDIIEEVASSNDIVDVVSQYVTLKRSGRNFLGLCPFHKEKTPSFSVSPDKQIFHCFGCGVGGNVIHFVSKIENISFIESLETLADKAGIILPKTNVGEDSKRLELKEKVYKINEEVAKYYHELLYTDVAKPAQEYVKKRKLTNKTLKDFQIGYAPTKNSLYKLLKEKGFDDEAILASTLVKKYNNSFVDAFKNRLMFPIKDVRNRVIAFGGRVLDDSKPKYINSPDTIVYNKGRNLYGLNVAKQTGKLDKIIIVEGYMDCISLHQRGITNVVASLGTALTENQGRLLKKYSEKIVISYDSDGAGQNATIRGLDILKNLGCDVRILQMEGAKDPDEFVIKYGNGRFNLLVENAISLVEFKAKMLKANLNLENANDKIKFLKEIAKLLQNTDSKIEQEIYLDRISKRYSISKESIYAEVNKINGNKNSNKILEKNKPVVTHNKSKEITDEVLQKREEAVIALLINGNNDIYEKIKNSISQEDIKIELNKRIVKKLYEQETENAIDLFQDDEEAISKITEIMAKESDEPDEKTVTNIINIYKKEKLIDLKNDILFKLNNTTEVEEKKSLEKELNDIIIKLAKIK